MRTTWLSAAVLGIALAACGDDSTGSGGSGSGTGGGSSSSATSTGPGSSTSSGPGSTSSSGSGGDDATSVGSAGGDPGSGGAGGGSGGAGGGEESGLETTHGGLELGEWMSLYWAWALSGDGDAFEQDRVFLALPDATDDDEDGVFVGEIDITLATDEGWAVPMMAYVGETYEGGDPPDDDPESIPEGAYTDVDVLLTLDGEVLIDSETDDLNAFFWDVVYYDEPVVYDEPTDYGAIAAIWTTGIGYLHVPLPAGEHVLRLVEYNPTYQFGYDNTWNITVE